MPLYSYVLNGGPSDPTVMAAKYELADDDGAIALSIAILRDEPSHPQVWVMENDDPVAVRIRAAGRNTGLLLKMR